MNIIERPKVLWRKFYYSRHLPRHTFRHEDFDNTDVGDWITRGITGYQQWYQHVDFGNGIVAHVTSPPDWAPNPALNASSGMDRFNFIIKRNLPDVSGMRVLDLGCNVGLYSLALARLGAREVIGVDRDISIRQRTGRLPCVDLISQAEFVRTAFEIRENRKFSVSYRAIDFQNLVQLRSLGKFDLIIALNVVYHELDRAPSLLETLGRMTDDLVLQSSVVHPSPIREWAMPSKTAEMLISAGFDKITIDSPSDWLQPIIRGVRSTTTRKEQ